MDKRKVLKIVLIIIIILFFVIGCLTIYKFYVINKIFKKMREYVALENYYMEITNAEDGSKVSDVYYKDGIGKFVTSNGIYTWTDGNEAYWIDDINNKIKESSLNSSYLISREYFVSLVPGYSKNQLEKFLLAGNLSTTIKIKKYDGIKYYVITTKEDKETKTVWVHYDTLLPSQTNIKIGEVSKSFSYNIVFEKVTNEEIKKTNVEKVNQLENKATN